MRILLFASLADVVGAREVDLESVPATVSQLDELVRSRWPDLAQARFRVSVNRRYARGTDPVAEGDEVALLPPVSGG